MPNDKKNCVMVAYSETGNNAVLIVGRKTKFINADIVKSVQLQIFISQIDSV